MALCWTAALPAPLPPCRGARGRADTQGRCGCTSLAVDGDLWIRGLSPRTVFVLNGLQWIFFPSMNLPDCFWSSCKHLAPTASPTKSSTAIVIDGARRDSSYPTRESFKGMQKTHLAQRILPTPLSKGMMRARQSDRLSSVPWVLLPASPASQAGAGWKQAGPWGGMQGAHGQCCLPVPWPASPAARSLPPFPPSGGPTATIPPTPAPAQTDTVLQQKCLY